MNRQICCAVFCALALSGTASHVHAAPGDGSRQEQLDEARRQEGEREARRREPSIHLTPGDVQAQPAETAPNGQTFLINEITLRNAADRWNFLTRITKQYEGRELDLSAVNTLLRELNQKLLARGYVTTRVTLPEQNLRGGHLVLDLRIGYMGEMKYAEGSPHIPWRNSFPIRKGDVLNLRALEQGVEQMHKVSSQRVDIRLIPSDREGYSDVELTVQRGRNVFGILSVDNSGLEATGKIQTGFTLGIDSPTGASDLLRLGFDLDGAHDGYRRGTRGKNFYYAVPLGYDTLSLSHYRSDYRQTVHVRPYPFVSGGASRTTRLTWNRVLSRTQTGKTAFEVSIRKRDSEQSINGVRIPIQDKKMTSLEFGISQKQNIGSAQIYGRLSHRMGVDWFGARRENPHPDAPKSIYRMWLLDLDYQKPIPMGKRRGTFTSSFHGQWTAEGKRLYGADMVSIGGRYTVRGFDGEYTLTGESGWYWQNEIAAYFQELDASLYIGLDLGMIYGPSVETQFGHSLMGAVLGVRGAVAKDFTYDLFIAAPIRRPPGFPADRMTTGFRAALKF